jgi:hydroxymethylglutaryl-CoA reductase (NADPH)
VALGLTEARHHIARALDQRGVDQVAARLAPESPESRPLPPETPGRRSWSAAARRERQLFLERQTGARLGALAGTEADADPLALRGNIELYLGLTRIPTGVVGPLRVRGTAAWGDYYVPLATTEGALVASYQRGARAVSLSGGATAVCLAESLQRAPTFVFANLVDASRFVVWALEQVTVLRAVVAGETRHGRLTEIRPQMDGAQVNLILELATGEAAGQNMATLCAQAIGSYIAAHAPLRPLRWYVEGNLSGDKKATALSFTHVRGKKVTAECHVPPAVVTGVLRTSAQELHDYWVTSAVNAAQSGALGENGHFANGLAALIAATGQDIACVSEAAVGTTRMLALPDGGLYASVTLPSLVLGTVGGGTGLPTQSACLRLLDCQGPRSAIRLAEICAALLLGGELSLGAALSSGEFARAHLLYGRRRTRR